MALDLTAWSVLGLFWIFIAFIYKPGHPSLWLAAALAVSVFSAVLAFKQKKRRLEDRGRAFFFCSLCLLAGVLARQYRGAEFSLFPLTAGVSAMFGPEVFLPVWAFAPLSIVKMGLPLFRTVAFSVCLWTSGGLVFYALKDFRSRTARLNQEIYDITSARPGFSPDSPDLKGASDKELADMIKAARQCLLADSASLFTAASGALSVKCSTDIEARLLPEGLIWLCFRDGRPVHQASLSGSGGGAPISPGYSVSGRIESLSALPLRDGKIVTGILSASSAQANAFAGREEQMEAWAALFSSALKRQRVHGEMERNLAGFEVLKDESHKLIGALGPSEIASGAVAALRRIAHLGTALFLRDGQGFRLAASAGIRAPEKERAHFENLKGSLVESTLRGGADPIYLSDLSKYTLPPLPFDTGPVRSVLFQPLAYEDEVLGVAAMLSPETNSLSVHQVELVKMFAGQLAVSLSRAMLHEKLQRLALTDGLTGLYNHRHFQEKLAGEFKRLERYQGPVSLLLIDIDFFKKINDTYGHPAGDAVLKGVAGVIKNELRESDFAARYGGEEFAALLLDSGRKMAAQAGERLRAAVAGTVFKAGDKDIKITISIGAASFPSDANSREALIELSDKALYKAKHNGRNQVVLWE
ncbi:MAG: sensor domain-containing diguanylate cyclase [Actinomycetota bacterium]|nr:sensor domain-containing diguanylate cyclase [Actinomycetota bacterium]